ncbi:hypothetical protein [Pseudorhodoferax sp.]|uniref:hypothetical protein n=1 Tax=Pseudorhodoferax sp. TaxID=1993553 RepID=UPI0039E60BCF
MPSPYDTPPDGDFARYVEQLNRPAAPAGRPGPPPRKRRPPRGPAPAARPSTSAAPATAAAPSTSVASAASATPAFSLLRELVQWAVMLCVAPLAVAVLVALVPPLAHWWGGLLVLAFLVFAYRRRLRLPWRRPSENR